MRQIASVLVLLSVVTLMGYAQSPASDIPTLLQPGSLLQSGSGSIRGRVLGAGTDEPLMRRPFDVTHYNARIEPNIADQTINGTVVLDLVMTAQNQSSIELDSGDLTIDAVKEGGAPLDFAARARQLTIRWPRPAKVNEARQLEVAYHGAPRFGIQFFPERSQVYTVFSTSQWLVCVDAPDDRATLNLSVVLPAGLTMVASGTLVAQHVLPNATVVREWRQDRPMPSNSATARSAESAKMRRSCVPENSEPR